MNKILAVMLALVLLFGITASTFAIDFGSIRCSSTSGSWTKHDVRRDYNRYNLDYGIMSVSGNATKLTVRPYTTAHAKSANAKTYTAGSALGGQPYWENSPDYICIKCNVNATGEIILDGFWTF